MMDTWEYFSTPVYIDKLEEYHSDAERITNKHLDSVKETLTLDTIYPNWQTNNFIDDEHLVNLRTEIIKRCSFILDDQGYDISNYELFFTEFWAQEHLTGSGHERHVHGDNVLTGFYFIKCPANGCRLVIYEPRPAKEFSTYLPEKNNSVASHASQIINFTPEIGQLTIFNAFIPHSFTRNESEDSSIFIHFNVGARYKPAEII